MEGKIGKKKSLAESWIEAYRISVKIIDVLFLFILSIDIGFYVMYMIKLMRGEERVDWYFYFLIGCLPIVVVLSFIYTKILFRELRMIQYLPITKYEFELLGCKTKEDIIIFLMIYKYYHYRKFAFCLQYNHFYKIDDLNENLNCFPESNKNRNFISVITDPIRIKEQIKSDTIIYEELKPKLSSSLITYFDKKMSEISQCILYTRN